MKNNIISDKQYKFLIGNESFSVKDENELALIFEMLSGDEIVSNVLHWNVIMELDENLIEIIKTYKGLINCLKQLNEKNSYLLLIKIGDILNDIISESRDLGEILAKIEEEGNKLRLLRQMRSRGLAKYINNSSDLLNIVEWVYDEAEKETLDLLGSDIIKDLFMYPEDIFSVLHYLNNENKDYLIDIIGLSEISKKIKTWQDLLLLIKGMSVVKVNQLLNIYSRKHIKDFFKNDKELHNFLMKLSDRKEKLFLEYLGIN